MSVIPFGPNALRSFVRGLKASPNIFFPAEVHQQLHQNPIQLRGVSERGLWFAILRACPKLYVRASLLCLCLALSVAGSTWSGIQILENKGAPWIWVFLFFVTNVLGHWVHLAQDRERLWIRAAVESFFVRSIAFQLSQMSDSKISSGNQKVLITSDAKAVAEFVDNLIRNLLPVLAAMVVLIPILVQMIGLAGWISLFSLILVLPVSDLLVRMSSKHMKESQERQDQVATTVGEWVKNIRLSKFLNWQMTFEEKISKEMRSFSWVSLKQHWYICLIFGLSSSWWMLPVVIVFVVSRVSAESIRLQDFFGSLWILTFFGNYFTHLPNTIRLFGKAKVSLLRFLEFFAQKTVQDGLVPNTETDLAFTHTKPLEICLRNVSFAYENLVLNGINLRIFLNQKTALLGEVGAGKSTLLKILMGELVPTSGSIEVAWQSGHVTQLFQEGTFHAFRSKISYVPQQAYVSNDTLRNNIFLEEKMVDPAELNDLLNLSLLSQDMTEFQNGPDQEIGEGGVNLSGGQRQRLNLARAFASRRHFAFMDDPLSAVDQKSEKLLVQNMKENLEGFLLVTHRLQEIQAMDRVLVLENGKILEDGRPEQLLADPRSKLNQVLSAYASEGAIRV